MNIQETYLYVIAIVILLLFSFVTSLYLLIYEKSNFISKLVGIIIIIIIFYLGTNMSFYLPFLGKMVISPNFLVKNEIKPLNSNITYELNLDVPDNTIIYYWGCKSMNKKDININPKDLYANYTNSGISYIKNKKTILNYYCPNKYSYNDDNNINKKRYIYYRYLEPNSSLLSEIKIIYIEC
jgi:hypothetical protein